MLTSRTLNRKYNELEVLMKDLIHRIELMEKLLADHCLGVPQDEGAKPTTQPSNAPQEDPFQALHDLEATKEI